MQCNCCKKEAEHLVYNACYSCNIKLIYKVSTGSSIPYWIENMEPLIKDEDNVVIIEGVDLRCVRYAIRELLTKMWPAHTIVLLNYTRTMLGIVHLPHHGSLRGIVFYSTRAVGKISPELAMSVGVSETKKSIDNIL